MSTFAPGKLADLRRSRGLSREALAVAVGRSFHTVRAYEVGGTTPSGEVIGRLADVLGCAVDDLYDRTSMVAS